MSWPFFLPFNIQNFEIIHTSLLIFQHNPNIYKIYFNLPGSYIWIFQHSWPFFTILHQKSFKSLLSGHVLSVLLTLTGFINPVICTFTYTFFRICFVPSSLFKTYYIYPLFILYMDIFCTYVYMYIDMGKWGLYINSYLGFYYYFYYLVHFFSGIACFLFITFFRKMFKNYFT